ncbi:MAG: aminotransferase [Flavobacteriales bacterium]|nr:MAG: aminotransferase [Flavobacteriales bacterium]
MIHRATRLNSVAEYYFSKKLREVRQLKAAGKPVINIGIGSPDLDPPLSVSRAMQHTMEQHNVHGYQSYQGLPELRMAMANYYQRYFDVNLNPDTEILPLMGSKEGIMHISMAFLNKGDKVLIPNPGYPTYTSVTNLLEAEPVFYNLLEENNWQPDINQLEKQDLSKIKIMWVNYPHMPTGQTGDKKLFEKLVAFARKHDILIVNDNPYSFILNDNPLSILSVAGAKDIALELNSLSKTFNMAGWRVGMLLGNAALLKSVLQVKSNMDSGMFYGIQQGAIAALDADDSWINNLNAVYKKRRNIAWQIADALNCTYTKKAVGLFVWAKLPNGKNAKEVADELLYKYNVFLAPGTIFGSNGEGYIRISLCLPEETLVQVLDRLQTKKTGQ